MANYFEVLSSASGGLSAQYTVYSIYTVYTVLFTMLIRASVVQYCTVPKINRFRIRILLMERFSYSCIISGDFGELTNLYLTAAAS